MTGRRVAASDVTEMRFEPGLRRTVVVRGDEQHRVDASSVGLRGELGRVAGVVRAATRDDRYVHRGSHDSPDLDLLVIGERARFARGAGDDETVVAVIHEPGGQRGRSFEVDAAVVVERSDHGGQHRAEPCHQLVSFPRSIPSVASKFSCSSNQTV